MLLTIDIGNTHTVLGLFKDRELIASFRMATSQELTADQLSSALVGMMSLKDFDISAIDSGCLASVVPVVTKQFVEALLEQFGIEPFLVTHESKLNFSIDYPNPAEIGADRLVNCAGAVSIIGSPCIIVDFGTATTVDVLADGPKYLGGLIAPGVEISVEALFARAAKLSGIDLIEPASAVGRSTADALRSGILYGFAGMADSMVDKAIEELGARPPVVATGGLAPLMYPHCKALDNLDPHLTLKGLQVIHLLNR